MGQINGFSSSFLISVKIKLGKSFLISEKIKVGNKMSMHEYKPIYAVNWGKKHV